MTHIIDALISEGLVDTRSFRTQANVQALAASTLTMTSASEHTQIFTGTTAGQIVKLPDATTISVGARYEIHNNSTGETISLRDASNTELDIIGFGQRAAVVLQVAGTTAGTWSILFLTKDDPYTIISERGAPTWFNDILFAGFHEHELLEATILNSGTAVINGATKDNSFSGEVTLGTGTTNNATGKSILWGTATNMILTGGNSLEWRVRLPVLSAASPRYNVKVGMQDNLVVGDPANGIYFQYSDNVNSGCWVGVTRNASTSTPVNSTVTVVANQWYVLRWTANTAGTLVSFYIDNVLIGTSALNIPTTNPAKFQASIEKGSTSTLSRTLQCDWYTYNVSR